MGEFLRSVLGVVVGVVVALAIIVGFDFLSSSLFPLPPGVDPMDPAALQAIVDQIPAAAFLIILMGWAAASFFGAWLAARIAGRAPFVHGMIVAVLLLIAGVMNMMLVPHPIWVWILGVAAFLGFGYLGSRLAERTMGRS